MAGYEGSKADMKADKAGSKKAGMSVKRFEGSKADNKKDAEMRKKMKKRKK